MRDPSEMTHAELIAEVHHLRSQMSSTAPDIAGVADRDLLDAVLAHTPVGLAVFDRELRCRRISASLASLLSHSPEADLGRTPAELLPQIAPQLEPLLTHVLMTGKAIDEQPMPSMADPATGRLRRWWISCFPVAGPDGFVAGVGMQLTDSTPIVETAALKQAEEALREREAQLQLALAQAEAEAMRAVTHAARLDSLLAHAPVGISLLDTELRFQHINATLAAMNGLPVEAHLGRTIGEVLPDYAATLEAIYGQVLATGEPLLNLEIAGASPATPEEQRIWRASYFPVRAADGALLGAGVVVEDITAQRQAEQARDAEHQQLESIVQTMQEGVIAFAPDGTISVVNPAGLRLGGLDSTNAPPTLDAMDQTMLLRLHTGTGQVLPQADWPVLRVLRGEQFTGVEVCLQEPAARAPAHWLTVNGTPVYDQEGALILGVITYQDISTRKQAELDLKAHAEALSHVNADLTRALTLKDEFLAMMSHELRTPLNVILGYTEGLMEGLYGSFTERQQQALASVIQSGRHLLAILSDILDLAHLDGGKATLEAQPVDIDILCRTALQAVQAAAQQKGIRLLRTVAFGAEGMRADERRLAQILANLLDNAVKFTSTGGTVGLDVAVNRALEQITFTVWDTGIGIAEEDYPRLFRPFTQVDGRLTRQYDGIGLGLTLVHKLVELHGGSVSLESTPGQGSRFTVHLPWVAAVPAVRKDAPTPEHSALGSARPPRVVIADDHEPTLAFYRDLLTQHGCEVVLARNGVEAVSQVRVTRPDVAVLDIQMPALDGLAAITQIRADPDVGTTPLIALTALALPGDRERCLAAGASAYLAKPASLRTLLATMAEALGRG